MPYVGTHVCVAKGHGFDTEEMSQFIDMYGMQSANL
jgi:hypothetical protein